MVPKIFTSQRTTQIVIDKKFDIKEGDLVKVTYIKNEEGKITHSKIEINDEEIGKFDLSELEEFLTIFLAEKF
jgi:hypothetical protein